MINRRLFLTSSALTAVAVGRRRPVSAYAGAHVAPPRRRGRAGGDPDLKVLAQRALDAATAAGASYADVRFTHTHKLQFAGSAGNIDPPQTGDATGIGVRALVRGAWGFVADTELTPAMAAWLGQRAAAVGKARAWPHCPPVELGPRPPAAVGAWTMPGRDPLAVPMAEHQAFLDTVSRQIVALGGSAALVFTYARQVRTFASTDGAFTSQTVYTTFSDGADLDPDGPSKLVCVVIGTQFQPPGMYHVPLVSPCGRGFEATEFLDQLPAWMQVARDAFHGTPFQTPGRFEVVFDADATAALVHQLGAALEVDRLLGYEADAGGTSYLAPLERVLGHQAFPAAVTVTADRQQAGGAATVRWDAEGIGPQTYPLVQQGVVVDCATSREFVPALARWYQAHGQAVRSRGDAGAASAMAVPLVQTPNLRLHPGAEARSFADLVAGVDDGLALVGGDFQADQQRLTAVSDPTAVVYRIKHGKLAGVVKNAMCRVRLPDLWKDLVALGGPQAVRTRGFIQRKGQPGQPLVHSVQAVPAHFKNVTVQIMPEPPLFI